MAARGIVIEFDFAALNGAELLFKTTKKFLGDLDRIPFDEALEARHLAGRTYQEGLARLFAQAKTKKTAQKAARDLAAAFSAAVTKAAPEAVGQPLRNFVKALRDAGVTVAFATRADLEAVRPAFESAFGEGVVLYHEESDGYGFAPWDALRRACMAMEIKHAFVRSVTGSGFGVKAALLAGMKSVAVVRDHVAYQDFSGANEIVDELSGKTAKQVIERV